MYYSVGQPIPFTVTASSPWQLTEKVQFSSSPPGLQGRVYPQGSSSNVLNCFLVLLSSSPDFTFWRVPSGDWLVHASKACLRWWSWRLAVSARRTSWDKLAIVKCTFKNIMITWKCAVDEMYVTSLLVNYPLKNTSITPALYMFGESASMMQFTYHMQFPTNIQKALKNEK